MAGAALLNDSADIVTRLYGMVVAAHHTGLPNTGNSASTDDGSYFARLKSYGRKDIGQTYDISWTNINHKKLSVGKNQQQISFALATYLKMLLSVLVDSDYTDTEEYSSGIKRQALPFSFEDFNEKLMDKIPKSDGRQINNIRAEILQDCLSHAKDKQGLFSLTVPTGGGKTKSSLAFAINHAIEHGLRRIIYVIPFTSIIEQNAKVIADALGPQYVLEHHSNVVRDNEDFRIRWATENWDIPIVITTNVQFFESFFSNRPSKVRKLHNLANSVIIFDEAQMLPREYLSPALFAICELVKNYGVSAVLCSATQPRIDKYKYKSLNTTEIAKDPKSLADRLKRVKFEYIGKKSNEDIVEMLSQHKKALVIVNSRLHAYTLYNELKKSVSEERSKNIYCLSTLIHPELRRERIDEIKTRLENEDIIVISTSLIEAGVDIDFPVVFRSLAGLDSIIQAAGRANREGRDECGLVFVFEPTGESGKAPRALQRFEGIGREIISTMGSKAFELDGIEKYFDLLYDTSADKGFIDDKKILDEFEVFNNGEVKFNYKNVAERFRIIVDNSCQLIVPVNHEVSQLITKLRNNTFNQEDIRKLGQYSVTIYQYEFNKLYNEKVIDDHLNFYSLNNMSYYSFETGLKIFSEDNLNADAFFL